jgi:hypothetical protein
MDEPRQPGPAASDAAVQDHPTLGLLVGLVAWGADAASERAREWSRLAAVRPVPVATADRLRARGLIVGASLALSRRAKAAAARREARGPPLWKRLLLLGRPALLVPGVADALGRGLSFERRLEAAVRRMAAEGERTAAHCEEMAKIGLGVMVDHSVKAVAQAGELREVLVDQSQGLVAEAVLEVRRRARHADSLLETTLNRMLHGRRRRREGAQEDPDGDDPGAEHH